MRVFNVKKILELAEECGNDKKFLLSKWVAVDDILKLISSLWCVGNTQIEVFSNKKLGLIKDKLNSQSYERKNEIPRPVKEIEKFMTKNKKEDD